MINPYVVYIKTNADDYVIAVDSSAFLIDTVDWIEFDSGYGDKYCHAQGNYFPKPIRTSVNGVFRYKLVDDKVVECTEEEIQNQKAQNSKNKITTPTTEERVEALEAAVTMLCMPDINEV